MMAIKNMKIFAYTNLGLLLTLFFFQNNFALNSNFVGNSLVPFHLRHNVNEHLKFFIPYNSNIVEIEYKDLKSPILLSKQFPYGKVHILDSSSITVENQPLNQNNTENLAYQNVYFGEKKHEASICHRTLDEWALSKNLNSIDCLKINTLEIKSHVFAKSCICLNQAKVFIARCRLRRENKHEFDYALLLRLKKRIYFEELFRIEYSDNTCEVFMIKKNIYDSIFN